MYYELKKTRSKEKDNRDNFKKCFYDNRNEVVDEVMEFILNNPGTPASFISRLTDIESDSVVEAIAYLSDFDYIWVDEDGLVRLKRPRRYNNPFGLRHVIES
ncbi:MAG: hypothetical protein V1804_04525 [Patescibacteria group bacterium]